MASYRVRLKRSVVEELEAVPLKDRRRIVGRIQGLVGDPRPAGCEKLSGHDKYRLRQGDCRILYSVEDSESEATVVKIGHRRDIYR